MRFLLVLFFSAPILAEPIEGVVSGDENRQLVQALDGARKTVEKDLKENTDLPIVDLMPSIKKSLVLQMDVGLIQEANQIAPGKLSIEEHKLMSEYRSKLKNSLNDGKYTSQTMSGIRSEVKELMRRLKTSH